MPAAGRWLPAATTVVGKQPLRLLITASGKHKDRLGAADFTVVNEHGGHVVKRPPDPQPKHCCTLLLSIIEVRERFCIPTRSGQRCCRNVMRGHRVRAN